MAYAPDRNADSSRVWYEEEIEENLKWCFTVEEVLHTGKSDFQAIELIESGPFGKVLLLDGKVQSATADEFIYHEMLVHPAMLMHPNPRTVFICGGGEGATAREVLRHKSVEKVVMVDIDKEVCDFCNKHLEINQAAFADERLQLVYDDAEAQLKDWPDKFDVIVGDLADPVYGGPCYQLYTQDFYQRVVKQKLNPGGIFVTQSGPAGALSCTEVFTVINNTLEAVFPKVLPYGNHIPSYCDTWGFNAAFMDKAHPLLTSAEEVDERIAKRLTGELKFLDGATLAAVMTLNKVVRRAVAEETRVYTVDSPHFIHGEGVRTLL